jgi:hypothetical protein
MKTTVECRDVRPATEDNKGCVVVTYEDARHGVREIDFTDPASLTDVKERLRAQGIVLGGVGQPAQRSSARTGLAAPVEIIAHDDDGKEHRFIADKMEEYSLSSGWTLYYFFVPETPDDCLWLKGRHLDVASFGACQPDIGEPAASADGGRDVGCSEFSGSQRGRRC